MIEGDEVSLGGWASRVHGGTLRLAGRGALVDGLRVACVALWNPDADSSAVDPAPALIVLAGYGGLRRLKADRPPGRLRSGP